MADDKKMMPEGAPKGMPPKGMGRKGMRGGPMPQLENPGAIMKRIIKYVGGKYKLQCILVLVCIIVSALANVRGTLFMKSLIDDYIKPLIGKENPDYGDLLKEIASVAVFYGVAIIAAFTQQLTMAYITQGTLNSLRADMFNHMESLPIKYFDQNAHGDIMSLYTNDIDTLRQMVSQSFPQLISSAITIISVVVSMIVLSLPLTLVTFVMVFIMLKTSATVAKKSGVYFIAQQKDLAAVNGYIEEMMEGQKVVKVFNHEDETLEKFKELNDKLFESANNANKYVNVIGPINGQLSNLNYVVCVIVGSILAINGVGGFTLGGLAAFLTFNKSMGMPINQVSMQMNSIVMALAGGDRIFKLLDEKPETDDGYVTLVNAKEVVDEATGETKLVETKERTGLWAWKHEHQADGTVTYVKLTGDVVFDDVDFGYVEDKIVLHNVDLFATPGQKIAFVGSTGAGKTTITNLINRFYDIQDGKIRYDGININKIKKDDLRHSLGMVLQDTHLFTDTIMENIRYGRLDATDEEVIAAAKLSNAHSFIKRLPEGYNTKLTGDGSNLSQGQRQLLAIARAAIANPPALILDEATSSIDTRTEKIVQSGMDKLMKGRTTFVIAHRLSTVKNSDCIMVLEKGRVIERGKHEELLEKKGRYYQLYTGNQVTA